MIIFSPSIDQELLMAVFVVIGTLGLRGVAILTEYILDRIFEK